MQRFKYATTTTQQMTGQLYPPDTYQDWRFRDAVIVHDSNSGTTSGGEGSYGTTHTGSTIRTIMIIWEAPVDGT